MQQNGSTYNFPCKYLGLSVIDETKSDFLELHRYLLKIVSNIY